MFVKLSFQSVFIYRANALVAGLAPIVWMIITLTFISVIFSKVKEVGGWTFWEVILLTQVHEVVFLLTFSTVVINFRNLVNDLRLGRADQDFLRPINQKFLIGFKNVDFTYIGSLVNVLVILGITLTKVAKEILPERIPGFFLLLAIAYVIIYFIHLILASISLFYANSKTLFDIVFEVSVFGQYPASIYPASVRVILTYFFPLFFFCYIPTGYLLGKISGIFIVWGILIALAFGIISRFVWNYGMKRYQSASS